MKSIKTVIIMIAAAFAAAGCCNGSGSLVLYYSQTGATKAVAENIAALTGADIEAFDVENPYGGSYGETIARVSKEREEGIVPALRPIQANLKKYDVIYLGYPIWFGTYAPPVAALLAEYDLSGKKIVPFCTFGSGGLESSSSDLAAKLPDSEIAEGYGVRNARISAAPEEIKRFLVEKGYIEGSVEPLPEYSEQQPVTKSEIAIFNAACGNYQFPLGTPVTAGSRKCDGSTEYKFTVAMKSMTGETVSGIIYVICPEAEGSQPEFTRVVR